MNADTIRDFSHALGLLACLSLASALADDSAGPMTDGISPSESLAWEARLGDHLIYVAGTIHVMPEGISAPPLYDRLYEHSPTIAFEADIWNYSLDSVLDNSPEPWLGGLSEATQSSLEDYCAGTDLLCEEGSMLFSPGDFCQALMIPVLGEKLGYHPELGIDVHYLERAQDDGKELIALESYLSQLGFLDGIDPGLADSYIHECIESCTEGTQTYNAMANGLDRMTKAFANGKASELAAAIDERINGFREQSEVLHSHWMRLLTRHDAWVEPLIATAERPGPTLALIGAAHILLPESSFLLRLEEAGYQLRPIRDFERDVIGRPVEEP